MHYITQINFFRMILLFSILLSCYADAHGVWVAQRTGEWAMVLGEGAVDDEYKPDAVKNVSGKTYEGKTVPIKTKFQSRNLTLLPDKNVAAVAISFEDGYWSQTADKEWHTGAKDLIPKAVKSGYYMMFNVTYLHQANEKNNKAIWFAIGNCTFGCTYFTKARPTTPHSGTV